LKAKEARMSPQNRGGIRVSFMFIWWMLERLYDLRQLNAILMPRIARAIQPRPISFVMATKVLE
jgi:hypothetical protein